MGIVRFVLGKIILFLDFLTSPKPIAMTQDKIDMIANYSSNLTLYEFRACPFCVMVRRFMKKNNIAINTKDAKRNKDYADELISGGGKLQVPCLKIEESTSNVKWMYESKDIIKFLSKELDL
ncbi:MAG: glutaredoxin domain-containing protein [Thermodesulfobacteriota bacterium]|nr:glutaredoxin domain-containing protein [Thermodesulfobacteriota bacterium]